MHRILSMCVVVAPLLGLGAAAQAQNPVANLEPTNPNNFTVSVIDAAKQPVSPVIPGLGLDKGATVTYLAGDPVRIVFPGTCFVQLAAEGQTSLAVDESACLMAGAVPLSGGSAGLGAASLAALGAGGPAGLAVQGLAVGGMVAGAIATGRNDEEAFPPTGVSPSSF